MDILVRLSKARTVNEYIVVITDRYYKLTRVIPTKTATATDVAQILIGDCVILYGIPKRLLTDNGPQLVGKFFNGTCAALGIELMTRTACHLQTNRQTERYNNTI